MANITLQKQIPFSDYQNCNYTPLVNKFCFFRVFYWWSYVHQVVEMIHSNPSPLFQSSTILKTFSNWRSVQNHGCVNYIVRSITEAHTTIVHDTVFCISSDNLKMESGFGCEQTDISMRGCHWLSNEMKHILRTWIDWTVAKYDKMMSTIFRTALIIWKEQR